jgi:hypothetical protein
MRMLCSLPYRLAQAFWNFHGCFSHRYCSSSRDPRCLKIGSKDLVIVRWEWQSASRRSDRAGHFDLKPDFPTPSPFKDGRPLRRHGGRWAEAIFWTGRLA